MDPLFENERKWENEISLLSPSLLQLVSSPSPLSPLLAPCVLFSTLGTSTARSVDQCVGPDSDQLWSLAAIKHEEQEEEEEEEERGGQIEG